MNNIYYDPEDFGLEIVTYHDFSDGCYQFDLRVIWKEVKTGRYLTARSSGCSCPSPFEEYTSVNDLEDFSESYLVEEAREEITERHHYNGDPIEPWISEIRELAKSIHKGGKKKGEKK